MSRELAIRAFGLYAPMALAASVFAIRTVTRRELVGAMLATIWTPIMLVPVHTVAVHAGWWTFAAHGGTLLGMPVDLYLGWAALWGIWPVLAFRRWPLALVVVLLVALDLVLMPLCEPVVALGERWLVGEAVAVAIVLVPAQLLGRWTVQDRQLAGRVTLQAVGFSTFMLWLVPAVLFEQFGGTWAGLTDDGSTLTATIRSLALQVLAIPVVLGLSAVREFVQRGHGTPVPFDPPRRLVTTGPYAYVANPMQMAMTLVFLGWGALLHSWWVVAAGAMAVVYSIGLAAWDEGQDLCARFGADWLAYRREVRAWWPRWRPFVAPSSMPSSLTTSFMMTPSMMTGATPARLYVAATCGQCSAIGGWIAARQPIGLTIVPAESHTERDLWRMTYDPGDGTGEEEGLAAFARALEHCTLGWAMAGMAMRLPLIRPCLQAIVDASGGGPQRIRRVVVDAADTQECSLGGQSDLTQRRSDLLQGLDRLADP